MNLRCKKGVDDVRLAIFPQSKATNLMPLLNYY